MNELTLMKIFKYGFSEEVNVHNPLVSFTKKFLRLKGFFAKEECRNARAEQREEALSLFSRRGQFLHQGQPEGYQ